MFGPERAPRCSSLSAGCPDAITHLVATVPALTERTRASILVSTKRVQPLSKLRLVRAILVWPPLPSHLAQEDNALPYSPPFLTLDTERRLERRAEGLSEVHLAGPERGLRSQAARRRDGVLTRKPQGNQMCGLVGNSVARCSRPMLEAANAGGQCAPAVSGS